MPANLCRAVPAPDGLCGIDRVHHGCDYCGDFLSARSRLLLAVIDMVEGGNVTSEGIVQNASVVEVKYTGPLS